MYKEISPVHKVRSILVFKAVDRVQSCRPDRTPKNTSCLNRCNFVKTQYFWTSFFLKQYLLIGRHRLRMFLVSLGPSKTSYPSLGVHDIGKNGIKSGISLISTIFFAIKTSNMIFVYRNGFL